MKKIISISAILLTIISIIIGTTNKVYAEEINSNSDITTETGTILIPFEKRWYNVPEDVRPDSINIKLYKYLEEEFDESKAILVTTATINKETEWKHEFDISKEPLFDTNNNPYKFKVVEDIIPGYEEIEHQDPQVKFTPPSVDNGWQRVTPCDQIDITTEGNLKTVIVAKMTGNQDNIFIVWTVEALTESERKLIYDGTKNINGLGNPKYNKYVYISGPKGEYYNNGELVLEVDVDHINFYGGTSVWSLFVTGLYEKSSTEANASYITNTIKRKDILVEKVWDDHNNILGIRPSEITVQLLKNDVVLEEIKLSENNSWKYEFKDLYEYTNGELNLYTVKELEVENYTSSIITEQNKITITNVHKVESTEVNVKKIWNNTEQIEDLPGVIVVLYYKINEEDSFHEIGRIILNETNNWEYKFINGTDVVTGKYYDILPADYIYEIKEIENDITEESEKLFYEEFFITDYSQTGNNWIITNTCTATYILPETGKSGALILSIVVIFLLTTPIIYLIYSFIKKRYVH